PAAILSRSCTSPLASLLLFYCGCGRLAASPSVPYLERANPLMRQRGAKRRQRGHEEIAGGRKLDELVRQIERRPTIAVGIIRSGFIHGPGTISRRLSNDRVETRRHGLVTVGSLLAADEAGIVGELGLDKLELPLDRCLIADEHQTAALYGFGFARHHLGAKRNAGANDAVRQRRGLSLGVIVARIDF